MSFTNRDFPTPITRINNVKENAVYIKRDDLFPFSFGGNKARKGLLFFDEIKRTGNDVVVTYGSAGSNHCRVVANLAASNKIKCLIISPDDVSTPFNRQFCAMFGASVIVCPVAEVAQKIDLEMDRLRREGHRPYFIPGGGHGRLGTRAYDLVYDEIKQYEKSNDLKFDYIFLASGTGTTQAGLICGKRRWGDDFRKIIGISIARQNPRGAQIVSDSVREYFGTGPEDDVSDVIFSDKYTCGGYGEFIHKIEENLREMMTSFGIPLDPVYTGKAYTGMKQYITEMDLKALNILFIHTGGTPLFFDWMGRQP